MDGHELGELFGLSTLNRTRAAKGALAVRLLLEGLAGSKHAPASDIEYPTRFTVRRLSAAEHSRATIGLGTGGLGCLSLVASRAAANLQRRP
ncbi:hypothetical protein [Arthrobacter sp. D1-17]